MWIWNKRLHINWSEVEAGVCDLTSRLCMKAIPGTLPPSLQSRHKTLSEELKIQEGRICYSARGECSLPPSKAACYCRGQRQELLLEIAWEAVVWRVWVLFAREQTQRGSSTESKSSPVAIEMGPPRGTRCRSLHFGLQAGNADIQCLKFYFPICSLLAFTQDAHLHRRVLIDLITATSMQEKNSVEPEPQLQ